MRFLLFHILFFWSFLTYGNLSFEREEIKCKIPQDQPQYEFNFKFKNIGKYPVKILSVKSSCSCTVATLEKNIYQSGEVGEITGIFNVNRMRGLQEQEITVYTDNESQSFIKLRFKIDLLPDCEINARLLYWKNGAKCVSKKVTLTVRTPEWELNCLKYDKNKFTVNVVKKDEEYIMFVAPIFTKTATRDLLKIELKNRENKTKTFAIHMAIK